MRLWSLYVLRHPVTNELKYVGLTGRPLHKRYREHLYSGQNKKTQRINKWIKGLLDEGLQPKQVLLFSHCDESYVRMLEKRCIKELKRRDFLILNDVNGVLAACKSHEERLYLLQRWEYMRGPQLSRRGRKVSQENIDKMREGLRRYIDKHGHPQAGVKQSPERIAYAQSRRNPAVFTEEAKQKIRESNQRRAGEKKPAEAIDRRTATNKANREKLTPEELKQKNDQMVARMKATKAENARRKEATINVEGYAGRGTLDPN